MSNTTTALRNKRRKFAKAALAATYLENFRQNTYLKTKAGVPAPSPNPRKFAAALRDARCA